LISKQDILLTPCPFDHTNPLCRTWGRLEQDGYGQASLLNFQLIDNSHNSSKSSKGVGQDGEQKDTVGEIDPAHETQAPGFEKGEIVARSGTILDCRNGGIMAQLREVVAQRGKGIVTNGFIQNEGDGAQALFVDATEFFDPEDYVTMSQLANYDQYHTNSAAMCLCMWESDSKVETTNDNYTPSMITAIDDDGSGFAELNFQTFAEPDLAFLVDEAACFVGATRRSGTSSIQAA
jgi:hypothetical protein